MTEIFVFGSNKAGRHGKGAALEALQKWGARQGFGQGLTGRAYAIPTKRESREHTDRYGNRLLETRSLESIHLAVNRFTKFAANHPNYTFLVTEIGCGLAGYSPREIAPLFQTASKLNNIYLPERFLEVLHLSKDRMSFDVNNRRYKK